MRCCCCMGLAGVRIRCWLRMFSNVLFGPGQPLDITKYFLISAG